MKREDIKKLNEYIDFFEKTLPEKLYNFNSVDRVWKFFNKITDTYVYHPKIFDFIEDCKKLGWVDDEYRRTLKIAGILEYNLSSGINQADLQALRAILTYYIGAEKDCDGFLVILIQKKLLLKILQRAKNIITNKN